MPAESVAVFSKGLGILFVVIFVNADLLFLYCLWEYSLNFTFQEWKLNNIINCVLFLHMGFLFYFFFTLSKHPEDNRGCEFLEILFKICLQMWKYVC